MEDKNIRFYELKSTITKLTVEDKNSKKLDNLWEELRKGYNELASSPERGRFS